MGTYGKFSFLYLLLNTNRMEMLFLNSLSVSFLKEEAKTKRHKVAEVTYLPIIGFLALVAIKFLLK